MVKDKKKILLSGKQWVLVMGEEADVTTDTCRLLENSGYRVYLTGSGDDAAECYSVAREYGYPFTAVIMDTSVAGSGSGRDAMKRLLDIDPDVRAIIVSGEREHPAVENFRAYGFRGALTKPFTGEGLDWQLHRALNFNRENT
jgi:two-component system cell cycle sensor histidine kinase/response regulator CckA